MDPRRDRQQPSQRSDLSITPTVLDVPNEGSPRRAQNTSDMSTTSTLIENAATARQYMEGHSLDGLDAQIVLTRGLTVNSLISTRSSFAQRHQAGVSQAKPAFNRIGEGVQGVVFEVTGSEQVVKRAKHNHPDQLKLEFEIHRHVAAAFERRSELVPNIIIPKSFAFYQHDTPKGREWWKENRMRFPADDQEPSNVLVLQHILPLPKVVRRALIEKFGPPSPASNKEKILNTAAQKHCLVRPYLAEARLDEGPRDNIKLQNFALWSNQLDDLGLDLNLLAMLMASALAVMHWEAMVDAGDVEFVLGSRAERQDQTEISLQCRVTSIFLLDFGMCKKCGFDEDGLRRRGMMFFRNDEYYPRPHSGNAKVEQGWNTFKEEYLKTSRMILSSDRYICAQRIIEGISNQVAMDLEKHNRG